MKTYYFQLKTSGKTWEETPVHLEEEIADLKYAANAAKMLAQTYNTEVRMTDNKELLGGSYFRPENL